MFALNSELREELLFVVHSKSEGRADVCCKLETKGKIVDCCELKSEGGLRELRICTNWGGATLCENLLLKCF